MTQPHIQQGVMNIVGWTLVVVGVVGAIASIAGLISIAWTLTHYGAAPASAEADGKYYVLRPGRHAVWPFMTSVVLSVIIACGGYIRTDRFVNRTLRNT